MTEQFIRESARPETASHGRQALRTPRRRRYVMTAPTFFGVEYAINPWMDLDTPVDRAVAFAQWQNLGQTYRRLGHDVEFATPVPGLPDMVYAANGGLIVNDVAVLAKFKFAERAGEETAYHDWMVGAGYRPTTTRHVNEGQGDLLVIGEMVLAGFGFRTDVRSHPEISEALRMPVISLELVDPRFYHLDTALAVLDNTTIAYYPPAFSAAAQAQLQALFPDAIAIATADAYALAANSVSDGLHVVHPAVATGFADQLQEAGFRPVGVNLSELLKGGGSIKCCTLEVHQ